MTASVFRAESGQRAVRKSIEAKAVDVLLEPPGQALSATLERAAFDVAPIHRAVTSSRSG